MVEPETPQTPVTEPVAIAPEPAPVVAPQPLAAQPPQPVQYIVSEKSLKGIGGWLIFWLIVFGLNALGSLWLFFVGLIGLIEGNLEGTGLAIAIITTVFGLAMATASTLAIVYIALSKKLGRLFAYASLGVSALYTTAVSITGMFTQRESCSYGAFDYTTYDFSKECTTVGLPASAIVALVGAIIVTWLGAFLIALYFKLSKRVNQTLVN